MSRISCLLSRGSPLGAYPLPRHRQPHHRIHPGDQRGVVDQLGVTGEDDQGQHADTGSNIGNGVEAGDPFLFLFADDQLNNGEQQGQPDRRGQKHGEDDADDQKAAEHKDEATKKSGESLQPQHATENIQVDAGQGNLERSKPAVGNFQRQQVEEDAEWVKSAGLPSGKEWNAGKDLWIPKRQLSVCQGLTDVLFPDGVLQHQVA